MQQLIYFIRKFRFFLLFLLLEILALFLTIQHHSYHSSKFINSANFLSGSIYNRVSSIRDFINLKDENSSLNEEVARLNNLIEKQSNQSKPALAIVKDSILLNQKYQYITAKVINNNYTRQNNFLTINKGSNDNIVSDLGVINAKGIIGVIKNTSSNYATVLSVLNARSNINVRLKNSTHFGTLVWNGLNYNVLQITDIPRQAVIQKGDTIITGGKSAIFPEGVPVGLIDTFTFENNQFKEINVRLFNDMSAISHVQIIQNFQKKEQQDLELETENE